MQQVLEAPKSRDEEHLSTAIDGDYPTARSQKKAARPTGTAEKTRQPMTWLRSLMSALTRPKLAIHSGMRRYQSEVRVGI